MVVDVKDCDLNNDYFHFTNVANIESIVNIGLHPSVGPASRMVGDEPNVSISQGGKGILGIINSFIFKFSRMSISKIPDELKKYFADDVDDFTLNSAIGIDLACRAMARKLKDEVYLRLDLDEDILKDAKIGGLTGYDIKLPSAIDKSRVQVVMSSGEVFTAYDFALFLYEMVKDKPIFREMNENFFWMFEMEQSKSLDDVNAGKQK